MPVQPPALMVHRGRRRPRRLLLTVGALVAAAALTPVAPAGAADGSLSLAPGRTAEAVLPGTVADGGVRTTFTVPARSGGAVFGGLALRADHGTGYRAKVRVGPDGSWKQQLVRVRDGVETKLAVRAMTGTLRTDDRLVVQLSVSGTSPVTVRMRSWKAGADKPAWQLSHADSAAGRITAAGSPRVWGYLSSSSTSSTRLYYAAATSWSSGTSGTSEPAPAEPVAAPAPEPTSSGTKPTTSNTGVPSGVALTVHQGDLVIKQAGTVIDAMDVRGFITVQAPNVTIKRSIVRGGKATFNRGVITNYGYDNLLIQDVDILPSNATVYQDGVKGSEFTMNRVYVRGNVDSVKIHGAGNVVIRNSLLENTTYFSSDPNQGGRPTHNDGVQVLFGSNIKILDNTIRGQQNFPVLGAANSRNTSGLVVRGNWLDGGHCTVKFEERNGYHLSATAYENRFGPHRTMSKCKLNATRGSSVSASANVMDADNSPVSILWTDS